MGDNSPLYRTRVEATNPWHGVRHWLVLGCPCMAREFEAFQDAIDHAQDCSREWETGR